MPDKKSNLIMHALIKFGLGFIMLGLILFLCAGSIHYWNAWLYLIALSIPIFFFGVYLYINDQELLKKRLHSKEKEKEQGAYVYITSISFLAAFALCGMDYRFGWSHIQPLVVMIALVIMLAGFGLFVITMLHNRFASRVIEIQSGQKVIDSGVYAVIRHPMYTAAIVMFFSSPFILGSYYAMIPMLFYLFGIILRIKNEEKVLCNGLQGYTNYMEKVKYRIIPFIW
ncbi:MAG: isoprenylcysteine carboxylmethyltransferase family protein [Clostridiales bacterium]|nr:isoprenylcysteine carboxylmethyltransferase family protein [Clostridiales bacterium]